MPVIYRTDGAWGSGKGSNLAPAEVDGNFYDIDTRVTSIEDNPVEPIAPIAINIEGSAFTMGLSNGETLGPITLTMPMPTWRGAWNATVAYNELDFFTSPDNGLGAVMIPHTSAATFDWGALDPGGTGLPVYRQLIGGSGTTSGIADLVDVALGTQADHDMLVWDAGPTLWRNQTPAVVNTILPAFGGSTGSAAGLKGLVPAPAAGDATAGKVLGAGGGWIVPPGGPGTGSLAGLADVAIVSPLNLSLLQYSSVDGKWHNQTLATLGAGTVTHVDTGAGLIGGPITGTGSISLEPIPTLDVLANVTGASAPAAGVSLSTLLDAVLGTARGSVMWRSATGWVALTAGTAGQFLRTGGTGADVTWGTPAGSGTVTQVNSGTGLTGGPITASGTLSLATVSDSQVLANISGGVAAPSGTTLTLLLDHALGATQGMIIYRGAASWTALTPGASGAVLTSGGAAANPSWVTGSGAGTVTNVATGTGLIGGPITGTGTISFATVGNQTVLANISGATAAPTPSTMSAIMDAVFSASRGSVIYRGAAGWAALGPGTAGQVLTTAGASADPSWAAAAGGASVTIGDTAPGSPTAGSLWWDSVGGQGYISFNDTTSTQWVPFSNQPGPTGPTGPTGPAGSANMSGMTAGQIPIAATATTVTSSGNLTGAVTTSGSLVTTLAANAVATANITNANVTYAKIQNVAANRLLGNNTGSAAAPAEIALPLAVTLGGTGSSAAWTTGSVVFAASATAFGEDNANLFWDNTNNRLGIGTTAPGDPLHVNNPANATGYTETTRFSVTNNPGGTNHTDLVFFQNALNVFGIATNDQATTAGMLALQAYGGTVGIGGNPANNGGGLVVGAPTSGALGVGKINAVEVRANNVVLTSDVELKSDIEPLTEGLPLVAAIEPRMFHWKPLPVPEPVEGPNGEMVMPPGMSPDFTERLNRGFLAQQVTEVLGGAVEDGVDLGGMVAVLWQAVRELSAKVAALEARPA